jgi:uncharacterized protein (UPF0332 family)
LKKEFIDLAKYRLEKAQNTLSDANKYIEEATPESTVNRIYYAMFYSVNALLIAHGLSSSKHSGVRAIFNKEFVNEGLIKKELGKFYSEMFDNRQEGDYKDFVQFEKENVRIWFEKASEFIKVVGNLTKKTIKKHK